MGTLDGFIDAVDKYKSNKIDGGFWLGDDDSAKQQKYGLVNLAAFLGQAMHESIGADTCNEKHDDQSVKDPACGQSGQRYATYANACANPCPDIPGATIMAEDTTLFCKPYIPQEGADDVASGDLPTTRCGKTWGDADKNCYPACTTATQAEDCPSGMPCQADLNDWTPNPCDQSIENADTQGCCHWGRGSMQTTGQCNYGKLNDMLGAGSGNNLYSDIDFCKNPEKICTGPKELKWVAGLNHWQNNIQTGFASYNYKQKLKDWVDGGMVMEDTDFIDQVSGIVNRGCPALTCDSVPVLGVTERRDNFETA